MDIEYTATNYNHLATNNYKIYLFEAIIFKRREKKWF